MGLRHVILNDEQETQWEETIRSLGYEVIEQEMPTVGPESEIQVPGKKFLIKRACKWIHVMVDRAPDRDNTVYLIAMEHERGCSRSLASQILGSLDPQKHARKGLYESLAQTLKWVKKRRSQNGHR